MHCLRANPITNTQCWDKQAYVSSAQIESYSRKNVFAQCASLYQVGYISSLTILNHPVSDTTSERIYFYFPIIVPFTFCHQSLLEVFSPLCISTKRVASASAMPEIISWCSYTKGFISHLHIHNLKNTSLFSNFFQTFWAYNCYMGKMYISVLKMYISMRLGICLHL